MSDSAVDTNANIVPLMPKVKPVKKGPDPFSPLLKEKHKDAKHGKGSEAIENAESIVLQYGGLLDEMEDEEDGEQVSDWGANVSSGSILDILNARSEQKDDDDLDEGDRERILEEKGGKTVLKILEQDRAERLKGSDKVSGIQLWVQTAGPESSAMAVDEDYHIPGHNPVLSLLNRSLKCVSARSSLLLNMNLMSAVQPAERAILTPHLLHISLSSNPSSRLAADTLDKFWSSSMQPSTSTITFKDVLDCLKRSGVDPRILAGQSWENENPGMCADPQNKDILIPRLVTLVTACARAGRLLRGEIADISVAMMLIGMDIGTSPALQREVTLTIESLMRCLSPDDSRSRDDEVAVVLRVLQLSASYSPVNKLRLLSLLSNGSGPGRRIADFVAYCIVTNNPSPSPTMYIDLPSLDGILDQLRPSKSNSETRIFALHEGTDYTDLGFYISILGVAVSNVKGYVSQERLDGKPASVMGSSTKMGDKPKTDLQLLHAALETLHSKISDSRAEHLERSRTKAAVKHLALIIHYQREFWLKHSRENRSITLAQYFKKKS